MARADKRQKQKAKRLAKKREARRREAVSPVKRLADAPGTPECWASEDFEELHQLQAFAYKRAAGLSGFAGFLVDRGVVGLKDAWLQLHVEQGEFRSMMEDMGRRGVRMRPATVDEVRRWVAGAARWAHDNGMRLPKEWTRAATLIGGVGDWSSADVSAFTMEFHGHPEDLRQRLVGQPFEGYVRRSDVSFLFSTNTSYMDQATGEYVGADDDYDDDDDDDAYDDVEENERLLEEESQVLLDRMAPAVLALTTQTADRLAARGEAGSEELFDAWQAVILASLLSRTAMPAGNAEEQSEFGRTVLDDWERQVEPSRRAEHRRAIGLVFDHPKADPLVMQEAVLKHLPPPGEGDDDDDRPGGPA